MQLGIMSLQASVAVCVVLLGRILFDKLNIAKKFSNFLWAIPYLCMVCPITDYVTTVDAVQVLLDIVGVAWLIGIISLLFYSANAHLQLHRKLICCVNFKENIYYADDISMPFVLGILKPRIYLPSDMSLEGLEYVLAHQKTHIRRKDPLKKMIAFSITCLHWFNPLAWVAFGFLSKDMEMACDEMTVQELGIEHRQDYAMALLNLTVGKSFSLGAPLAFHEGNMKSRIKNIIKNKKTRCFFSIFVLILLVFLTIGFMSKETEYVPPVKNLEEDEIFFESLFHEIEAEKHALEMEELITLCQEGPIRVRDTMSELVKEHGMIYTNMTEYDRENVEVYTWRLECTIPYNEREYLLRIYYRNPDNPANSGYVKDSVDSIYLYETGSGDVLRLYAAEPKRHVESIDISDFLSREYNIEQYFTCTLPQGTWLGEYKTYFNDVISGCSILGDFKEISHGESAPSAWYAPGGLGIILNDERLEFSDGMLISARWLPNHSDKSEPEQLTGCEIPAVLYEYSHDIFTLLEWEEYLQANKLSVEEFSGTSQYWYVFLGEENGEYVYTVFLNQAYFTKEDVIELARSVRTTCYLQEKIVK